VVRLEPITPGPAQLNRPSKLQALIDSGKVIDKGPFSLANLPKPLPPLKGDKTLSDLIIEERDESLRRFERSSQDHPR